jgi:aminoglycoside phosphotransferase (APT) family kinase protein
MRAPPASRLRRGGTKRKPPAEGEQVISKSDDESGRKWPIDARLVTRLVASQFPQWAGLAITPVESDGRDNTTFRLGAHMSVRLPSAAEYTAQVDKENRWLPILAPQLPLPIPVPLALGEPAEGYPWKWSVYRWIEGAIASTERIDDLDDFATTLAHFLAALQRIDASEGPAPGQHNFFRGGPLKTYDAETRSAIAALDGRIDSEKATAAWETAIASTWHGVPVWFHGDVSAGNLLIRGGRLSAVIDFGTSGIGDPACDVTIAWTLLSGESREEFRAALAVDSATWARGRGWALWKCLILLAEYIHTDAVEAASTRHVLDEVLADHERWA